MTRTDLNVQSMYTEAMHLAIALAAIVLLLTGAPGSLHAQSRPKSPTSPQTSNRTVAGDTLAANTTQSEEPADLAFRTVNGGYGRIAGRERSVAAPPHLTQAELTFLETRRRGNEQLVPLRGYPTAERRTVPSRPGYADASIGLNATAQLHAGYSGTTWPFDYSASLAFDMSNGHARENPHRSIGAAIGAGYIIGDDYGLFSGGHMGADVRYDNYRYHLYALPSSPARQSSNVSAALTGSNAASGLTYEAGARYRSLSIADDSAASRETMLQGTLGVSTTFSGLSVGATGDVRLTYLDGTSISYGHLAGFGSYSNRFLTARVGLQLAAGANSDAATSGTIAPVGELRLFPIQGLTLIGTITGGLTPTTLAGLSAINPYTALQPTIRQQRESIGYQIHVRVEPSRAFALRATAARSHYNDYAYFDGVEAGQFAPHYASATVNRIVGDLVWQIDASNNVLAVTEFTEGTLDDARVLPYTPRWVAELHYTRRFASTPYAIEAGVRYIGTRTAAAERSLAPVVLLNAGGRYAITQRIDLTVELRNLLDSRYELWDGYTERGIYAAVGASARF